MEIRAKEFVQRFFSVTRESSGEKGLVNESFLGS